MGPDNGPVGLCFLQFGGEALSPAGLLGVVLPSFVFLVKKLADELHGTLGNARERGAPPNQKSPRKRKRRHCAETKDQN